MEEYQLCKAELDRLHENDALGIYMRAKATAVEVEKRTFSTTETWKNPIIKLNI